MLDEDDPIKKKVSASSMQETNDRVTEKEGLGEGKQTPPQKKSRRVGEREGNFRRRRKQNNRNLKAKGSRMTEEYLKVDARYGGVSSKGILIEKKPLERIKVDKLRELVLNESGWDADSKAAKEFMLQSNLELNSRDEIDFLRWIFNTFKRHLKICWQGVSDLESLKKVLEEYFREKVLEQSRLNKNMVLTQRFEEFFSRSNSFYFLLTCFALHCVHHLDTGQVCEILDFCLGYEEEFYAEIVDALRRNEDNWFSTMKKTWLKKVHEVESSYLPILARQSWSVEVYDFFIKKYRNEFEEERLSFLKNKEFRSLCQTEVLKLAISSPTLAEYPENYERFSFHRHVYALLHHLRMTSQYDTLIMVIDKILKAQENVGNIPGTQDKVGAFCKRAMSTVKGKRNIGPIKANFLIALICQILIYNIDTNSLSWLSRANQPSNKRIFRENILNKVFSPELHENKFIEDIIKEICGEDRSQSSILESQYHVFRFLWAKYKNFSNLVVKETVLTCLNADEVVQPYLKECGCLEEKERTRFYHLLIVFQAMGYQHKGFSLRKVQVLTVLYLAFYPQQHSNKKGVLARMFTGEGKTVVVALLAAYLALEGKRVDVLTSSSELARDQVEELIPFYKFLGISVDGLEYEKEEDYKSVSELEGEEEEISTATVQVLYGTAPSYIRELLSDQNLLEKRRERFERKPDVAIVDEVDNMLFDRSNALIQLSSIETATLMPLLYPILMEIYFQVKESYPNYKPPKDTNGEEKGQIVNYLLREFKESNEPDSPAKRLKELLETKRRRIRELFPPLERVDGDDFTYIGSFYDYSCLLSISKLPLSVTKDSLTTYIYSQLARVDSEAVCKRIMFTNYSSEKVDAWVLLDKEDAVHHLVDRGAEKFEDCEISFARCHDSGNKSVSKIFSSPMRMQRDIGQAKNLAKLFDSESNIQGGLETFLEKYCRSEPELDFVVGYLWRVHFFCYYSQNQFESLGDLVSRSLSPTIRLIPRKNKQSKKKGNTLIDFDKNIQRMLNSVECRELREECQDIERLNLKPNFFELIQSLPRSIRRHALFQFEAWVENCYLSIMRVTKDVAYVSNQEQGRNIKIDAANTGVLQENTHLSDGLQQFLSMKEDRYIVPPSLTSNFMSLVGFYKKYGAIYGLTGTLGNQDTIDFLVEEYQVDCVNIPSNFMPRVESPISHTTTPYRCFEFPPLVMKKRENWLLVIAESVKQQLTLGRPVLVFCSSLLSLEQYIKPKLEKMNDSLTKSVPIKRYDAISEMKDKEIEEKMIILATNIAGRGTDLKVRRELKETGGLHICLTFLPESERVELQCVGRTARNGEMGSAQLILLDREGRDIKTLKENRKEMNVSKSMSMRRYVEKLTIMEESAEEFRVKFNFYCSVSEEQENAEMHMENKNRANSMRQRMKALYRMRLSYLQHEWFLWMKRNFLGKGRGKVVADLEEIVKNKILQLTGILESTDSCVQHHVFTALEAFHLLFETKTAEVDSWNPTLEMLFRTSGVMRINADWKISSAGLNTNFPGLAVYYLAAYKLRLVLAGKALPEHKYIHVINGLIASKQAIDIQIMGKMRSMRQLLIPTNKLAKQLRHLYMAFEQLVDIIESTIATVETFLERGTAIYELKLTKVENMIRGISDDMDEHMFTNIVQHCKAFGYSGHFTIIESSLDPLNDYESSRGWEVFRGRPSSLSLYPKNMLPIVSSSTGTCEDREEYVAMKIDSTTNILCSIDDYSYLKVGDSVGRLGLFLYQLDQSKFHTARGRLRIIQERTWAGIQRQTGKEPKNQIFNTEGMKLPEGNLEEKFQSFQLSRNLLEKIGNDCERQIEEHERTLFVEICHHFYEREILKYLTAFEIDVRKGKDWYGEQLIGCFANRDESNFEYIVDNYLCAFDEGKSIVKKTAIDYAQHVYWSYFATVLGKTRGVLSTQSRFVGDKKRFLERSKLKYKSFVLEIIQPFLDRVVFKRRIQFKRKLYKAKKLLQATKNQYEEAVLKAAYQKAKSCSPLCFCCDSRICLSERLERLASAFQLVIVFINVPTRTQIFITDCPVAAVRVYLQDGEWSVKCKRSGCLLELLSHFYFLSPENHRLLLSNKSQGSRASNTAEDVLKTGGYNSPVEDTLKVAWYNYTNAAEEDLFKDFVDVASRIMERHKLKKLTGFHNTSNYPK